MSLRVIAIVVTYNRLHKLKKTVRHLLNMPFTQVLVVDNASTDGTGAWLNELKSCYAQLEILSLPGNQGGAGGFHAGVKHAHEQGMEYDYLLLQDDDAVPAEDALHVLERIHPRPALAAAVYEPDGKIHPMNRPGYNPFGTWKQSLRTFLYRSRGFHVETAAYYGRNPIKVDFCSFVGFFVSRNVVSKVGYPDPDWFIYGDDVDYTLRITNAGIPIYFVPQLKYEHDCETLQQPRTYTPVWKAYYTYRNGLILAARVAGRLYPLVVGYRFLGWLRAVFSYPKAYRKPYLCLMFKALKHGLAQKRPPLKPNDLNRICKVVNENNLPESS